MVEEYEVTRVFGTSRVPVGIVTITEKENGRVSISGRPDPPTEDNIDRMQQIIRRVKRSYGRLAESDTSSEL